jgi:hypothetical protein
LYYLYHYRSAKNKELKEKLPKKTGFPQLSLKYFSIPDRRVVTPVLSGQHKPEGTKKG